MFANGLDYDSFLDSNCYQCPLCVDYDKVSKDNPVCPIEERIALAGAGEVNKFPYEHLRKNDTMPTYSCLKFEKIKEGGVINED